MLLLKDSYTFSALIAPEPESTGGLEASREILTPLKKGQNCFKVSEKDLGGKTLVGQRLILITKEGGDDKVEVRTVTKEGEVDKVEVRTVRKERSIYLDYPLQRDYPKNKDTARTLLRY